MPISLTAHDDTNLLEVVVNGTITHEDYQTFVPVVERMVQRHGAIRVLLDMIDFHGWEAAAVWDDVKFAFHHSADITHIAMVGDQKWEKAMSAFCKPFTRSEICYFDWSQLKDARAWLELPLKAELRHAAMGEP